MLVGAFVDGRKLSTDPIVWSATTEYTSVTRFDEEQRERKQDQQWHPHGLRGMAMGLPGLLVS